MNQDICVLIPNPFFPNMVQSFLTKVNKDLRTLHLPRSEICSVSTGACCWLDSRTTKVPANEDVISYDYDDPSQKYQEGIKVSDRLPSLISSLRTSPLWAEQPAASRRGMRNTLRRKFMLLFCQGTIGTTKVDVFSKSPNGLWTPPSPPSFGICINLRRFAKKCLGSEMTPPPFW